MIIINLDKAKEISHGIRRTQRSKEFAPLDDMIAKRIPGATFEDVEAKRQAIRDKYAAIQSEIDAASSVASLDAILKGL